MASWLLFLFLLLALMPIVSIFHHLHKNNKNNHKPPGPPGLPFIGNMPQFDSAKPHEFLGNLSEKYGPLMSLKLGGVPVVVISSAKIAKEALKSHDAIFSGRPPHVGQKKLSYNGLDVAFSPYGEYWREMKKICVLHLLNYKSVQSFRPIIEDEVSLLIKEIISDLSSSSSSSSQVIDFSAMATELTSTITCRIAFGKKYDRDGHEKKRFDQITRESQALFGGFFVADYLPLLGWIDRLSGMSGRLEKNFKELDLFYQELIDDHLNPDRPNTMKDDIIDLLIQIKDQQSSSFQLTWDHIKAMLMNVFIGGTDTSATIIVWVLTALMKAPSALKRVQAEIRDLVSKKGAITEETIEQLPYLDAIIKETLRFHPPVPIIPRQTTENCSIQGYEIKAKTMVMINMWAIARDPESWENPEEFIPERFMNSSKIDVKGNDFELIPFGSGRRGCPGMWLGMLVVKVTLANLLYYLDWELPFGMEIQDIDTDTVQGLAMQKKTPLCLVAKKYI